MSKEITAKDILVVSEEVFNSAMQIKEYCNSQRNCHDCKVKKECKRLTKTLNGCDISSLQVGRIQTETGYKYTILCR